jgi:hypothetical protein
MVPIVIAIFVVILPHLVAILVCLVAITVSISIPRYLPAAVPASVVSVMIVSSPVIGIMIVPDYAITEAWVIAKARFILTSPLPIFSLALAVQPVVLDIIVAALSQPFPVVRIVVSVVAARAVIGIVS